MFSGFSYGGVVKSWVDSWLSYGMIGVSCGGVVVA